MSLFLVTGANRGIGLELCRQIIAQGDQVIATCRQASEGMKAPGITIIENVDVTSDASVDQLAGQLAGQKLDVLINNAGILTHETLADLDFERIRRQFEVNTLGPLRVSKALLPNLSRGSKIAIISSRVGSIGDNGSGGIYGYRISKAAVNMVGVNLSLELKEQGIAVVLLHPGLIATEMTSFHGDLPEVAAKGLLAQIDQLRLGNTGSFWHANGEVLPW